MLQKDFNNLVDLIRSEGMIYFKTHTTELKDHIGKLEGLNTIKSTSASKIIYYILLELMDILQENNNERLEYDIKQLENKFFDYNGIVKESLK